MQYYTEKLLPVTHALAKEYTIFDGWFASIPGPTFPNRHFLHCATAYGETQNYNAILGYPFYTIYDSLMRKNISWRVYRTGAYSSVYLYRKMRHPRYVWNIRSFLTFKEDARDGKLPSYSFIDPDFEKNDDHPPHDMREGEAFLREVYNTLRSSPSWNQTVLLVTYDEVYTPLFIL
jgi:phospholipase C